MRQIVLAVGLLMAMAVGCTAAKEEGVARHELSGSVTLDGKPLAEGRISFDSPEDASQGIPPTSGEIKDGKYSVKTTTGTKTVRISHRVESGRDEITKEPIMTESIPAKFNKKSDLTTTVSDGKNIADFEL
ncbi:hypothetical protein [Bremerella alba]|uniref:Carboxypeptidase regulatory-like domain-containing protein n=1 Tax=Bremerella alba TaxID=980252 RepID=A0A7V8V4M8_9BACT|nr:hypothetical protein [Bremerella alba]MBA2114811.1 hypothetical protein [Bremerella alba]